MKMSVTHCQYHLRRMHWAFVAVLCLSPLGPVHAEGAGLQSELLTKLTSANCTGLAWGTNTSAGIALLSSLVPSYDHDQMSQNICACASDKIMNDKNIVKLSMLSESEWKQSEQRKALTYIVFRLTIAVQGCSVSLVNDLLDRENIQF